MPVSLFLAEMPTSLPLAEVIKGSCKFVNLGPVDVNYIINKFINEKDEFFLLYSRFLVFFFIYILYFCVVRCHI